MWRAAIPWPGETLRRFNPYRFRKKLLALCLTPC